MGRSSYYVTSSREHYSLVSNCAEYARVCQLDRVSAGNINSDNHDGFAMFAVIVFVVIVFLLVVLVIFFGICLVLVFVVGQSLGRGYVCACCHVSIVLVLIIFMFIWL